MLSRHLSTRPPYFFEPNLMLYLITLPPPLQAGLYDIIEISAKRAGKMINHFAERGDLVSRITFSDTASALSEIGRVHVPFVDRNARRGQLLDNLEDGDMLIQAKLKPDVDPRGRVAVEDLEFLLIKYTE